MNLASSTSLDLARRLLAEEAARGKNSGGRGSAEPAASQADHAVRVCEGLREVLTAFAGTAGFRSLLTRALTLAKSQERSLAAVQVLEDGSLAGLEALRTKNVRGTTKKADSETSGDTGGEILVAYLLDLLVIFIGEPLTLQLVRSAWPDVPTSALRSRN